MVKARRVVKQSRRKKSLPRAKKVSETKLIKKITLEANLPTFTTAQTYSTPYWFGSNESSFNFTITNNGHTDSDLHAKDFIKNGTGMNERIGRQITLLSAREKILLEVIPVVGQTLPTQLEVRVVQGWVKSGIDDFMDMKDAITTLYSEVNWVKYRVLKDYIVKRRALGTGIGDSTDSEKTSYRDITINNVWSPNRVLKWDKDTAASSITPAQYEGYAPFLLIFNPSHATAHLKVKFHKRTITFKDL